MGQWVSACCCISLLTLLVQGQHQARWRNAPPGLLSVWSVCRCFEQKRQHASLCAAMSQAIRCAPPAAETAGSCCSPASAVMWRRHGSSWVRWCAGRPYRSNACTPAWGGCTCSSVHLPAAANYGRPSLCSGRAALRRSATHCSARHLRPSHQPRQQASRAADATGAAAGHACRHCTGMAPATAAGTGATAACTHSGRAAAPCRLTTQHMPLACKQSSMRLRCCELTTVPTRHLHVTSPSCNRLPAVPDGRVRVSCPRAAAATRPAAVTRAAAAPVLSSGSTQQAQRSGAQHSIPVHQQSGAGAAAAHTAAAGRRGCRGLSTPMQRQPALRQDSQELGACSDEVSLLPDE